LLTLFVVLAATIPYRSAIGGESVELMKDVIARARMPASAKCEISSLRGCPGSNCVDHGPVVGTPVTPHIAAPVPVDSATQTDGAITITAVGVMGSTSETAANVIAAKMINTPASMTAPTGKCRGGKPATSENKENCKNAHSAANHFRPFFAMPTGLASM
jgi:hypothetical protein